MRSLQDWTRYLEQQEQGPQTPERVTEVEVSPPPAVEPPTHRAEEEDIPAFLRVKQPEKPVESAPPPKPAEAVEAVKSAAVSPKPAPQPVVGKETIAKAVNLRKRLPKHLNDESIGRGEIAGSSYKAFKESREELIQRLVDPILSLEEVARILNVCPTTVRRYTNRGAIAHHRTAGNQRRFRLSDVLAFMERQSGLPQE